MSEIPVPSKDSQAIASPEVLDFDEGLRRARVRIDELLQGQSVLTVAINGSGTQVGKTYLAGQIGKGLLKKGVPTGLCVNPGSLDIARDQVRRYREQLGNSVQAIYILDAWEAHHGTKKYGQVDIRSGYDGLLRETAVQFDLFLEKVDLWIAIFSEQTPFIRPSGYMYKTYDPFEDIIICNNKAKRR